MVQLDLEQFNGTATNRVSDAFFIINIGRYFFVSLPFRLDLNELFLLRYSLKSIGNRKKKLPVS